jgi:glycosyltransferase involved in cell wall biosynthesis
LREQIESLLHQTLPPAEIVVVDDGSTDNTPAIVESYAQNSRVPIRFHANPERLGYRRNFMKAMKLCRSGVIALCDQDDVWAPAKLERLAPLFTDPSVLLAHHAYDLIDARGAVIGRSEDAGDRRTAPLEEPPTWNNPPGFSMLVRAELLRFDDVYPLSVCKSDGQSLAGHDQWLYYLAASFGVIVGTSEVLAGYRQHGANVFGEGQAEADPAAELTRLVAVLDAFANCLERAADPPWPVHDAVQATRRYRNHLASRLQAISAPRLTSRIKAYAGLVAQGAYLTGGWRLGRRTLIEDARRVLD